MLLVDRKGVYPRGRPNPRVKCQLRPITGPCASRKANVANWQLGCSGTGTGRNYHSGIDWLDINVQWHHQLGLFILSTAECALGRKPHKYAPFLISKEGVAKIILILMTRQFSQFFVRSILLFFSSIYRYVKFISMYYTYYSFSKK